MAIQGIAQIFAVAVFDLYQSDELINLFPQWIEEMYIRYASNSSRKNIPLNGHAFVDFLTAMVR